MGPCSRASCMGLDLPQICMGANSYLERARESHDVPGVLALESACVDALRVLQEEICGDLRGAHALNRNRDWAGFPCSLSSSCAASLMKHVLTTTSFVYRAVRKRASWGSRPSSRPCSVGASLECEAPMLRV
jgi:hypothetical protein